MKKNISTYVKSILIPLLVGILVSLITSSSMEYSNFIKPSFAPPNVLFPIVWTIIYILMGVSYGILKSRSLTNDKIDSIYYFQLFVNAMWSIFFFNFEWRLFSFFWIILLILLVILMIKDFYEKNKVAGLLQIPYLIWLLFASILNLSIYLLN